MMLPERTTAYVIVLTTILLLIFIYLKSWFRCVLLAFKLRGPKTVPFFGNVLLIGDTKSLIEVSDLSYKSYGSIMRAWISVVPVVFVLEPKDIQVILGSSRHTNKSFVYSLMHNFIGRGLISNSVDIFLCDVLRPGKEIIFRKDYIYSTSKVGDEFQVRIVVVTPNINSLFEGDKWKLHRKLVQPYFHINILDLYASTFWQSSSRHVEKLTCGKDININTFVNDCVLDTLHETILGIGPNETTLKSESPYRKGEMAAPLRIQKPWYLLNHVYKFTALAERELKQSSKLYQFSQKILNLKRNSSKISESSVSLMQYFMEIAENNPKFDDNCLINEICTFMLAGQDSVAAAVSFTLYNLAAHQSVQEKAYSELESIFKNSNRPTDVKDLQNMKYLEQCIKESMRMYPSVPMISRKLSEDVVLGEHTLPAGCTVFISPYTTHRLEHHYKNPTQFDPDRFSAENLEKLHPFAFIPFSAGPRNCIGYKFALIEIKMIVSTLLRRFHVYTLHNKQLNISYRITLRAKGGVWLRLELRK